MLDPWIVLCAAGLESMFSYPAALQRIVPHPVVWVGHALNSLEARWNNPVLSAWQRKFLGVAALLVVAGASGLAGYLLQIILMPVSGILVAVVATVGLAHRSLYTHVAAVMKALDADDLPRARSAVGMIVGRDVDSLDASGITAAALESLAESFNDGVIAPLFWLLLGGLPGLFIYKACNTADSIIGHKEPRWKDFGWCAARTDDLLNLLPARLAGGLICMIAPTAWPIMVRDARKHASPNAGWPEAAMAGALRLKLGGAASYDGLVCDRPTFGDGSTPTAQDLRRGLRLYVFACAIMWAILAVGEWLWRP
jgi:adenosylcobinamide-phosphate synthase